MRIETNPNTVERSGTFPESTFKIKASPKAFDILSSRLYPDPIRAIVREISCNAYDSHVAAGKADVPFHIHFPNQLEPYFFVKDSGTGLSHEQVMDLYTTYFESSKTESNDFIGALGLGSKSPFSYTDAYQVIVHHDGMKRTYSIFRNEERKPTVALINEIETNSGNGLEVRITVKSEDFYAFSDAATRVLKYFPVKPKITGISSSYFSIQKIPATVIQGSNWAIVENEDRYAHGGFVGVQGYVEYPIAFDQLKDQFSASTLNFLSSLNIIAYFPIGDLEVSASREELHYDKKTKASIVKVVNEIQTVFIDKVEQRLKTITSSSFWDQYIELEKISMELFRSSITLAGFISSLTTNPILLNFAAAQARKGCSIDCNTLKSQEVVSYSVIQSTADNGKTRLVRHKSTYDRRGLGVDFIVEPNKNTAIIIDDTRGNLHARLSAFASKDAYDANGKRLYTNVVVIRRLRGKKGLELLSKEQQKKYNHQKEINKILSIIGNPSTVLLSAYPLPPKAPKADTIVFNLVGHKQYKSYGSFSARQKRVDIDWKPQGLTKAAFTKGGLYIHFLKRFNLSKIDGTSVEWSYSEYERNMSALITLYNKQHNTSYTVKDIVGIRHNQYKKFQDSKNWTEMFSATESLIDSFADDVQLMKNINNTPDVLGLVGVIRQQGAKSDIAKRIMKLDDDSHLKVKFLPLIEAMEKIGGTMSQLDTINNIDATLTRKLVNQKVKSLVPQNILDPYPMLTFVSSIRYSHIDRVFEYINLVDRS